MLILVIVHTAASADWFNTTLMAIIQPSTIQLTCWKMTATAATQTAVVSSSSPTTFFTLEGAMPSSQTIYTATVYAWRCFDTVRNQVLHVFNNNTFDPFTPLSAWAPNDCHSSIDSLFTHICPIAYPTCPLCSYEPRDILKMLMHCSDMMQWGQQDHNSQSICTVCGASLETNRWALVMMTALGADRGNARI